MATLKQGAAGTRIKLIDLSEVTLVTEPIITAGVVGFSSKGEFNKIIDINNTAQMDTILGNGYNDPRFNQGLYASRTVITGGGLVEFVRPYGETIVEDDNDANYNSSQQLKTDTFLVEYDFSDGATGSFGISNYASTRWYQDALAGYGKRQINTISDTITKNSNIDFVLDADTTIMPVSEDGVSLFAIMNTDPTAARRAGDRWDIKTISYSAQVVTVDTKGVHNIRVGDTVYITGTTNFNTSAVVTEVPTTKRFKYSVPVMSPAPATETDGAAFVNTDTVDSGVDNIKVNTVARGQASKSLDIFSMDDNPMPSFAGTYGSVSGSELTIAGVTGAFTAETGAYVKVEGFDSPNNVDGVYEVIGIGSGTITIDLGTTGSTGTTGYALVNQLGNTFELNGPDGVAIVNEFVLAGDDVVGASSDIGVVVVKDSFTWGYTGTTGATGSNIIVTTSGTVSKGDVIRFEEYIEALPTGLSTGTDYYAMEVVGDVVTLGAVNGNPVSIALDTPLPTTINNGLVNITATLKGMVAEWVANGLYSTPVRSAFDGSTVGTLTNTAITVADASKFDVGDLVNFYAQFPVDGSGNVALPTGIIAGAVYEVSSVDLITNELTFTGLTITATGSGTHYANNLTKTKGATAWYDAGIASTANAYGKSIAYLGYSGLQVPIDTQESAVSYFDVSTMASSLSTIGSLELVAETTDGILLDASVGRQFLALGLAIDDYIDTDFDGKTQRVFTLTDTGKEVARFYLFVEYQFAGETYNFAGTLVPYIYNERNLYIGDGAEAVENGWKFMINENAVLQSALLDSGFDMSLSVQDGLVNSQFSQIAFNPADPAIVNDAVWDYDPRNNVSSSTMSTAWNLFLDKDSARADMLVAAGTAINNLFVRGLEQIDYIVMDNMLNICEKRKDMFAIFDGVDEPDIEIALRKMVGVGSQGELARWGAIFDGRSLFFDSVYTKLTAPAVRSIQLAYIITANRAGNAYWIPPAGYEYGRIPAALSRKEKFLRSYNYAEDENSDVARLYDANINPTRVNDLGQFIYGQKTMLKRSTALNRLNVIMLVAGLHKRFWTYLDNKVFQLNTAALRNNIQSDLQAQLELIKSANPAGLTAGRVICDETNNTPDIIDTNQLIVDVLIQPTRSAEYITLRTTVQRTGADLSINSQIIGG